MLEEMEDEPPMDDLEPEQIDDPEDLTKKPVQTKN